MSAIKELLVDGTFTEEKDPQDNLTPEETAAAMISIRKDIAEIDAMEEKK